MSELQKKTLQTKRSTTYTYYVSPKEKADVSKPALFFIHGFPDSALMWSEVIDQLADLPYRMVAPDQLGYAGTSKPTDPSMYKFSAQSADLLEVLQAEGIEHVIIVGHDWGAALTHRFYNHYPQVVDGVISLNVAYRPPTGEHFDLDAINAMTQQTFGYALYPYWYFFTADDGAKVINENLEAFWEVLHGAPEGWMKEMFCVKDAIRNYITANNPVSLKPYAQRPKWKDHFIHRFGQGGFEAPVCWYKAQLQNIQTEDEKTVAKENHVVKVPFFFVGCTGDPVCRTDLIDIPREAGLLPDFEMTEIESGHWCAMEAPEKVSQAIRGWMAKRFP